MRIAMRFGGDEEVPIEFPEEGVTTSALVTCVGDNLYRLDAVPFGAEEAGYRDVIEAGFEEDGKLRVRRVAERSEWRTYDYLLSPAKIHGDWEQSLLRRLEELGGHWEWVFDGLLLVCLPPGVDLDPTEWVYA